MNFTYVMNNSGCLLSVMLDEIIYSKQILDQEIYSEHFQINDIPKILRNEIVHRDISTSYKLFQVNDCNLQLEFEIVTTLKEVKKRIKETFVFFLSNNETCPKFFTKHAKLLYNELASIQKDNYPINTFEKNFYNLLDDVYEFNSKCDLLLSAYLEYK